MKTQDNKFLTFLESVQNNNNTAIITAITKAYHILEGSELMTIEGEEVQDHIPGGLADDYKSTEFDSEQLAMGLIVEMEHTDDPKIALEIAMDHLTERDDYYTRLVEMEASIESDDEDEDEDEERSELTEAKKKKRKKKKKSRKWAPFKGSRMLGIGYPFMGSFSSGGDSGFSDGGGFGGDGGGGGE